MVTEEPWVEDLVTVAQTVSYTIWRNYKGFTEVDDIKQELLEWSLRRPDKLKEWLSPDLPKPEYRLGIKRLSKTFNRLADKYCRKEKAKKLGYSVYDEAFYSSGMIEELLPYVFSEETVIKDPNSEYVSGGGGDPATAGTFIVSVYDVRNALATLSSDQQAMIEMKYADGLTLAQIAELYNISKSTVSRKINTGIRSINKELGGDSPWR